ncbi:MAG TPA: TonB-dependent receptor [Prolixibacteraceae bacterium]|nr:TonB-dependent receptor [Prolixibacteraceae bacterium]
MRYLVTSIILMFFIPQFALGQSLILGKIKDANSGETLIGANILVKGTTQGTVSDIEGNYSFKLQKGTYELQISYVGYKSETTSINVDNKNIFLNFSLKPDLQIDEVLIVADIAKDRETPVAFTNVLPAKIQEELAGQDIPMVLNSTPGVYATAQGGGDGDARITIRGFNQRNVAVMLDGIPVNDMENGWVYWSNWFGLDAVTRNIQVQRGLSASKLALPSVGGTLNIITKGVENKAERTINQSVDQYGKIQTNIGFTSGMLKHGWGITGAFAYKNGNSWVDELYSKGFFFYLKIDKRWKNHITSVSAMGAPQQHSQRSFKRTIAKYDTTYARQMGAEAFPKINNMGIGYNQHWGYLKRDRYDENAQREVMQEKANVYHKPQFSVRDFWSIGNQLTISNIMYLSLGNGGGDGTRSSIKETQLIQDPLRDDYGQIDWQSMYNANSKPTKNAFGYVYPINNTYSDSLYVSDNYITRACNDHVWFGYLGTATYKVNDLLTISGGADVRSYTGIHYTTIQDLLGGDYAVDTNDKRKNYNADPSLAMSYVGDTIYFYDRGLVRWGGLFGQVEYTTDFISTFLNISSAYTGYKKEDYFGDLNSPWVYTPSFTLKTGANFNISKSSNVFFNLGYLSKTRDYKYFFKGHTAELSDNIENEKVKAVEVGYHYGSPRFSANVNGYFTQWQNKPTSRVYSTYILKPGNEGYNADDLESNSIRTYADIPGMDALHMGLEFDFIYKVLYNLELQGLISLGDWTWDKAIQGLQFYNYDNNRPTHQIDFDATGIHVGDAAQTQLSVAIRYEPIKNIYINARLTYFDRYYADFSPESTTDKDGNPVDSWKLPSYSLLNLHAGYNFRIKPIDKIFFSWRVNVLNVLNTKYISDAVNNDSYSELPYQNFDAKSATVFFGAPRNISTSLQIRF